MIESYDEAKHITDYMDISAPTQEADLLFVFGNALDKPAFMAAEAMAANRAKHVVLTGGNHKLTGANEAQSHQKILLECSVPPERIILENESQNTRENVLFALPQIIKRLELDDVKSIMVLALWQHCRRATMTLKRHLPIGTRYSNLTYEHGSATLSGWWHSEEGCNEVIIQWHSIQDYLERDHIAEIQKQGDVYV